ncbi:hypothetical protein AB0M22_10650 [Nocardia sp. NPDC051756]|uniref:hypothetical protein n=1 Tax=Nocardia sp. NPDC051756 TaxID=3154751 RepID=UPI0034367E20
MTDRSTSDDLYAVPEADLAEQSIPAYPNDLEYADDRSDQDDPAIAETWNAAEADVIEQSIAVPFDDEPDPA